MKFLIHSIKKDSDNLNAIFDFVEELNRNSFEVFFVDSFYNFICKNDYCKPFFKKIKINELENINLNFIMSFGGDGTVLQTLDIIKHTNVPIIGINTGNLGFLTKFSKDSAKNIIEHIINNTYTISERTILEVSYDGRKMYALNEVSITRIITEILEIKTYINGKFLGTYRSDGLIISTATGSTAYSLSCGGPILMPEISNLILTPIAPHNLNFRPLIISENSLIKCCVNHRHMKNEHFNLNADTKTSVLSQNIDIKIKKTNFNLKMFEINETNFFDTIREKLLWGGDYRLTTPTE